MLKGMRKYSFGAAAAAALFVIPISAFSQSIEIGPDGVRVGRGGQCEQLRRACENKDALGERGEGNCRTYRETCQRPVRRDECGELRQACLSTRTSWANKAKEIAVGIARLVEVACRGRKFFSVAGWSGTARHRPAHSRRPPQWRPLSCHASLRCRLLAHRVISRRCGIWSLPGHSGHGRILPVARPGDE